MGETNSFGSGQGLSETTLWEVRSGSFPEREEKSDRGMTDRLASCVEKSPSERDGCCQTDFLATSSYF